MAVSTSSRRSYGRIRRRGEQTPHIGRTWSRQRKGGRSRIASNQLTTTPPVSCRPNHHHRRVHRRARRIVGRAGRGRVEAEGWQSRRLAGARGGSSATGGICLKGHWALAAGPGRRSRIFGLLLREGEVGVGDQVNGPGMHSNLSHCGGGRSCRSGYGGSGGNREVQQ